MASSTLPFVLLLGAKSLDEPLNSVPAEISAINELFQTQNFNSLSFKIEYQPYLTRKLLTKKLEQLAGRVAILHFAGHSYDNSLQTDDELVYSKHIAQFLKTWRIQPTLIFLNGCNSAGQIELFLKAGVNTVIATHKPINDLQASQFALEFYKSLFAEKGKVSLQDAFDRAGSKVFMGKNSQPLTPNSESIDMMKSQKWDWGLFSCNTEILKEWTIHNLLSNNRPVLDQSGQLLNPYKGLESFKEEDQEWFFGREALSLELSHKILESSLYTLLGASGSGKSSLISAGVIPKLRQNNDLIILQARPGASPFKELANLFGEVFYPNDAAQRLILQNTLEEKLKNNQLSLTDLINDLLKQKRKSRLLICIDQFEELFTHSKQEIIQVYIQHLIQLIDSNCSATLLLIMRADFLGTALAQAEFAKRLDQHPDKKLGLISPAGLRASIEKPANRQLIQLEPSLTSALLDDIKNQIGGLPLLQFVLNLLWQKRDNNIIKLSDYNTFGGLEKALETRADAIYAEFNQHQKLHCKLIFLRLIQLGDGAEDTRRHAYLDEFESNTAKFIIKQLADARLITTQRNNKSEQAFAEISHEALIQNWSLLRKWIEENRSQLRIQHQISSEAKAWEEHKKNKDWLLSGTRLNIAEEWISKNNRQATELETNFIKACIKEKNKLIQEKERLHKRNRIILMIFVITLGLITLLAVRQWQIAIKKGEIAIAATKRAKKNIEEKEKSNYHLSRIYSQRSLSSLENGDNNQAKNKRLEMYRNSWIYALEALKLEVPTGKTPLEPEILKKLTSITIRQLLPVKFSRNYPYFIHDMSLNPKGDILAFENFNLVGFLNLKTGKTKEIHVDVHQMPFDDSGYWRSQSLTSLTYIADDQIAVTAEDNTIKIINGNTEEISTITTDYPLYTLVYDFQNDTLISESIEYAAVLWNMEELGKSEKKIGRWAKENSSLGSLALHPTDSILASSFFNLKLNKSEIKLFNSKSGKLIKRIRLKRKGHITSLCFHPNGKELAISISYDNKFNINLWDIKSEKFTKTFKKSQGTNWNLKYSPNGKLLASGNMQGEIKIWDSKSGDLKKSFSTGTDEIKGLLFYSNTELIYSTGNTIIFLDIFFDSPKQTLKSMHMTQDLFFKYKPQEVLNALEYLWGKKIDQKSLKVGTTSYNLKNDVYLALSKRPKEGENKVDQLIKFLKKRCAFINQVEENICKSIRY